MRLRADTINYSRRAIWISVIRRVFRFIALLNMELYSPIGRATDGFACRGEISLRERGAEGNGGMRYESNCPIKLQRETSSTANGDALDVKAFARAARFNYDDRSKLEFDIKLMASV